MCQKEIGWSFFLLFINLLIAYVEILHFVFLTFFCKFSVQSVKTKVVTGPQKEIYALVAKATEPSYLVYFGQELRIDSHTHTSAY